MGYRYRNIKVGGKTRLEHRCVWEQANGAIPAGFEIHHKNHDPLDNRLENLELKDISGHRREHALSLVWRPCAVSGCSNKYESNGYCKKHYYRLIRTGNPLGLRGHSSSNPKMVV